MTLQEELEFFAKIEAYTAAAPENLEKIIRYATRGVIHQGARIREHAVDMEVVASMALNARLFKGNEKFIADKLERWSGMNGLRWDDQIKRLREKKK